MPRKKSVILIVWLVAIALATTVAFHLFNQPEILYAKGKRLFENRLHEQALPYFVKSNSERPRRLNTLRLMGFSALWTGRFEIARDAFNTILDINPKDLGAKRGLIDILARTGHVSEAKEMYGQLLDDDPADLKTMLSLAYLLYFNGEYDKAKPLFVKYLLSEPTHQEAIVFLADSFIKTGERKEASNLLSSLETRYPSYTPALKAIAMYHLTGKDYEKAVSYYKRVLEIKPDDIEALSKLADTYMAMGDSDKALEVIDDAVNKYPGDSAIMVQKGNLLLYSKNYPAAESVFLGVLKKDDDEPAALQGLANTYAWQGKTLQALPYLEKILSGGNISQDSLRIMAESYLAIGMPSKSADMYERIIAAGDYTKTDLKNAITAFIAAKRLREAEKQLRKLIDEDPSAENFNRLGDVLSWQGRFEEAERAYKRVVR